MEQLLVSFLGGIAASLSPCSLAGLPLIIGYIGSKRQPSILGIILINLAFTAGLLLVLAGLGLATVLMGNVFGSLIGESWRYILAVLIILMGLKTMELLPFRLPGPALQKPLQYGYAGAFALGAIYAVVSSPCATPILAGILAFAALQGNLLQGMLLLTVYGIGQSLILFGLGLSVVMAGNLAFLRRSSVYLQKVSGALMVGAGIYLVIAQF